MLSEEEKKAIEFLKFQLRAKSEKGFYKIMHEEYTEIVLNLITRLEKENESLKKEKEEKDKQIDLMALTLSNVCTGIPQIIEQFEKEYCEFINSNEDCCWKTDKNCQDCIKEYIKKQAKEKGDNY